VITDILKMHKWYWVHYRMVSKLLLQHRGCNTLVSWGIPIDRLVLQLELLREMEEQMVRIKHNLKTTQDKQKS
jgi:hypothetical protein